MCALLVVATSAWVSPTQAWAKSKWFKSRAGGYQLAIPADWYVREMPGDGQYEAALSRERVEKDGDLYRFGVSVVRLRDYRAAFKFSSSDPASMAMEFAIRLAGDREGGSAVIGLPSPLRGMESSLFRITKDGGTDQCLAMWLLVRVSGTEWFHALWEIPCTERESQEALITSMTRGLAVLPKWGK